MLDAHDKSDDRLKRAVIPNDDPIVICRDPKKFVLLTKTEKGEETHTSKTVRDGSLHMAIL